MICLHCGDCCLRMSPLTAPEPCPQLIQIETFYFCGNYERRPIECINHQLPGMFCPVGLTVLGLDNLDKIRERIDAGYKIIKGGI